MKKPGSRPLTSSPVNTPLGPTMVRIFSISVGSTEAAIAALADLVITAPTFCFAPRRDGVEHGSLPAAGEPARSEEHTSELQSLMRISYAVFCLKKKTNSDHITQQNRTK